jgi:hypothetical protein
MPSRYPSNNRPTPGVRTVWRCDLCFELVDPDNEHWVDKKVYHFKCSIEILARKKHPQGYKMWCQILERIAYLETIDPTHLYGSEDKLKILLDEFGFDPKDMK